MVINSYTILAAVEIAGAHGIHMVTLPPHSTHIAAVSQNYIQATEGCK